MRNHHNACQRICMHTLTSDKSTGSPVNIKIKYGKEVRFAFGVALSKYLDGNIIGMRIKELDYTE